MWFFIIFIAALLFEVVPATNVYDLEAEARKFYSAPVCDVVKQFRMTQDYKEMLDDAAGTIKEKSRYELLLPMQYSVSTKDLKKAIQAMTDLMMPVAEPSRKSWNETAADEDCEDGGDSKSHKKTDVQFLESFYENKFDVLTATEVNKAMDKAFELVGKFIDKSMAEMDSIIDSKVKTTTTTPMPPRDPTSMPESVEPEETTTHHEARYLRTGVNNFLDKTRKRINDTRKSKGDEILAPVINTEHRSNTDKPLDGSNSVATDISIKKATEDSVKEGVATNDTSKNEGGSNFRKAMNKHGSFRGMPAGSLRKTIDEYNDYNWNIKNNGRLNHNVQSLVRKPTDTLADDKDHMKLDSSAHVDPKTNGSPLKKPTEARDLTSLESVDGTGLKLRAFKRSNAVLIKDAVGADVRKHTKDKITGGQETELKRKSVADTRESLTESSPYRQEIPLELKPKRTSIPPDHISDVTNTVHTWKTWKPVDADQIKFD